MAQKPEIYSVEKRRIYITVKTYPAISEKYAELVCTAGIQDDGSWVRLYPLPFRMLNDEQKFKKYTWIEVDVEKNNKDFRPESYRPALESLRIENPTAKTVDWEARKKVIFKSEKIYTNKAELIELAKKQDKSLAIFKPSRIKDFIIENTSRDWDTNKKAYLETASQQLSLFWTPEEIKKEFALLQKIPYKFSYCFEDDAGIESTLMIEDWEIGMLYLNSLKYADGNEKEAVQKVREKYLTSFLKRDIYFFMGTTLAHHRISLNPFIIIGVFYPPKKTQNGLFDDEGLES
jgi:hypothetical protein